MRRSYLLKQFIPISLAFCHLSICHAHYALECYQYTPEITTINCHHYRCHWDVEAATDKRIDTRARKDHDIEKYCREDMYTTSLEPFEQAPDILEHFTD